jgi:riboflavin synthase
MFTGIITDVGRVRAVRPAPAGAARLLIETSYDLAQVPLGGSIACSGTCLTVIEKDAACFAVDASAETLACTTIGAWREGTRVNLERALRLGEELGGHLVSGHVDGVALLEAVAPEGESRRLTLRPPGALLGMIASKGSVALDGISLTVNEVSGLSFGVNLIPHTQAVTTLGAAKPGDRLNLEIDLFARYVARLIEVRSTC